MHTDTAPSESVGETRDIIVAVETAPDLIEVRVEPGNRIAVVIAEAARGAGIQEEVFVFADDADEPIDVTIVIGEDYPHHRRHHVHRHRNVAVTVNYNGAAIEKTFSPAVRIERVLRWAIAAFRIDVSMASEFDLTRDGEAIPGSEHLGRFAHHPHGRAEFDLGRGPITNGAP